MHALGWREGGHLRSFRLYGLTDGMSLVLAEGLNVTVKLLFDRSSASEVAWIELVC